MPQSLGTVNRAVVDLVAPIGPAIGNEIVASLSTLYDKLLGRSGGHNPDPNKGNGWLIMLGIILGILGVLLIGWFRSRLPFTAGVLLLILVICSAPIVSIQLNPNSRILRILVEISIVMASVTAFVNVIFGSQFFGRWFFYVLGVLLVLEIGGHLVEWNKDDSISRLSQWDNMFKKANAATIDRVFRREQITYLSVPVGFLLGLGLGLWLGYSDLKTVLTCLVAILFLASLSLAYFLTGSFIRMCEPILFFVNTGQPRVSLSAPSEKAVALFLGIQLLIFAPPAEGEEQDLDLSGMATSLRKIYLYDSLHNVLLLIAFVAIAVNLFAIQLTLTEVVFSLLIGTFLFSQFPFAIGQNRLHRRLLWPLKGTKEVELAEKLAKVAPRFPAFQLLNSLATTGTGSLLYILLNEAFKNRFKLPVG